MLDCDIIFCLSYLNFI